MEDKDLMEKELLNVKSACDLYMHGTVESTTAEAHMAFKDALNTSLDIQNKLYNLMSERGWYSTDLAEQTKINQVKQKFQNQ